MAAHHGTIRKYTAALLNYFNELEIQYEDSSNNMLTRNVPSKYGNIEKFDILDGLTDEQIKSGNHNVLPRASLVLSTTVKSDQRVTNKNNKINTVSGTDEFEYMFNSVPYEFTYELSVMCRGMNEATQIIEQIAPQFNPTVNIDIWDGANLHEPTRVPMKLLDIGFQPSEFEELSTNIVTVDIGLSIIGNLYPPVRTIDRIKDFKIYLNEQEGNYFSRKSILGWDVDQSGELTNGTITQAEDINANPPVIIDMVPTSPVIVGDSELTVIYDDPDNKDSEMTFDWIILQGDASVGTGSDVVTLTVNSSGTTEVQVRVTDPYGNYTSLDKTFNP